MSEPIFDDARETLAALLVVRKHLDTNWISEGCRQHDDRSFGCISCRALSLDDDLAILQRELEDDIVARETKETT